MIVKFLTEKGIDTPQAKYWAGFSQGSIAAAISWATLEMKEENCYSIKKNLITRLSRHRLADSLEFADWICQQTKAISSAWSENQPKTSKKDITRRTQKGVLRMILMVFYIGSH